HRDLRAAHARAQTGLPPGARVLLRAAFPPRAARAQQLAGLAFRISLAPVSRDRLPLARKVDERVPLRPDSVARVEEPEAHAPGFPGVRILAPERAAADRAETFGPAVFRRVLPYEVLTRKQTERPRREPGLRRGSGTGPALAARAVAVAGAE